MLVTGTLAEPAVRAMARRLSVQLGFDVEVVVLRIQVAALMTAPWVARRLQLPAGPPPDRVIVPGHCRGDLGALSARLGVPVEAGPKQLHDLPRWLDPSAAPDGDYAHDGPFDIEILAEINHAAHLPTDQILSNAEALVADGADVIDLGCDPQTDRPAWAEVGTVVRELCDRGMRVSIDTFHAEEAARAAAAGAELVLSVNATNRAAAVDWGTAVVVLPDDPHDLDGLDATMAHLERHGVPCRIDPVVEPIGFGFAGSLGRYIEARRRFPQTAMLMGVGNLTEMTGVDSAGVNLLLAGFCQELAIGSVLTTQVINWARTTVRELDVARRLVRHAVSRRTVPKHQDARLVMLRDPCPAEVDEQDLSELGRRLTDRNVRIFADPQRGLIHAMNRDVHAIGEDPFALFERLGVDDPGHAFYLGYEMAKAVTAITLGKAYTQDDALEWGMLTRPEIGHHERRGGRDASRPDDAATTDP